MRSHRDIFLDLETGTLQENKFVLGSLKNKQLEQLYFEICDFKKLYPNAYHVLSNELNLRKDKQIQEVSQ